MRWINVKNVDELKTLGKFAEVKKEIKKDVGDNIKFTIAKLKLPMNISHLNQMNIFFI